MLLPAAEQGFIFFSRGSGHIQVKVGAPSFAVSDPPAKARQDDKEAI